MLNLFVSFLYVVQFQQVYTDLAVKSFEFNLYATTNFNFNIVTILLNARRLNFFSFFLMKDINTKGVTKNFPMSLKPDVVGL